MLLTYKRNMHVTYDVTFTETQRVTVILLLLKSNCYFYVTLILGDTKYLSLLIKHLSYYRMSKYRYKTCHTVKNDCYNIAGYDVVIQPGPLCQSLQLWELRLAYDVIRRIRSLAGFDNLIFDSVVSCKFNASVSQI